MLAMWGSLAAANVYRFSSKEWNGNSGLYYYLYRFYDPNLQRWVNRDPISELGFQASKNSKMVSKILNHKSDKIALIAKRMTDRSNQLISNGNINLYEFVDNEPISQIDLFGLIGLGESGPFSGDQGFGGGGGGCPCPPGQTPTPYWQVMGYEDVFSCGTAEWSVFRDGAGAILGGILGDILGGGKVAAIVGGLGGMYIPALICTMQICN
jgi:RHS repeat-associated protein